MKRGVGAGGGRELESSYFHRRVNKGISCSSIKRKHNCMQLLSEQTTLIGWLMNSHSQWGYQTFAIPILDVPLFFLGTQEDGERSEASEMVANFKKQRSSKQNEPSLTIVWQPFLPCITYGEQICPLGYIYYSPKSNFHFTEKFILLQMITTRVIRKWISI